jgi:hypothetical protein
MEFMLKFQKKAVIHFPIRSYDKKNNNKPVVMTNVYLGFVICYHRFAQKKLTTKTSELFPMQLPYKTK